jgi:hypothetical protein
MATLTPTRRLRRKKKCACANAPPRKYPHQTPLAGFVKGEAAESSPPEHPTSESGSEELREDINLDARHDELRDRLDDLHEEGVWTGPDHSAVTEALTLVERAVRRIRTNYSSGPTQGDSTLVTKEDNHGDQ